MAELGLFPLGLVLLPTERLPLHVFEDRYKELIGECLEQGTEFGFVYTDDQGLREVGTRARISDVLTRFDDGRMNVLVEGGERFRLDELTEGRSFATANVSPLDDDDETADASVVEDALRTFGADQIVISTHPEGRSNWLERGLVTQARERFAVPVDHVVVDLGERS